MLSYLHWFWLLFALENAKSYNNNLYSKFAYKYVSGGMLEYKHSVQWDLHYSHSVLERKCLSNNGFLFFYCKP